MSKRHPSFSLRGFGRQGSALSPEGLTILKRMFPGDRQKGFPGRFSV